MKNLFIPSTADFALISVSFILCALFMRFLGFKKRSVALILALFLPIVYFSAHMATEAITCDEPKYESCITNVRAIKNNPAREAVLYEYKFSQATLGTLFLLLPRTTKEKLGENGIWKVYKAVHYLLFYLFCIATALILKKYVLIEKSKRRSTIFCALSFFSLIALPLPCLLLKVTNYDAGSTYPAVLAVVVLWSAYKKQSKTAAFLATIICALGVLDKWPALPYWAITTMLYCLLVMEIQIKTGGGVF